MKGLSRPATLADIIGWAFVAPIFLACSAYAPSVYDMPAKLEELVGGARDLPWATSVLFGLGGPGLVGMILAVGGVPVLLLLMTRRPWVKVAAPAVSLILVVLYGKFMFHACVLPMLELSSKLRGA